MKGLGKAVEVGSSNESRTGPLYVPSAGGLRRPLFISALVVAVLFVLLEVGSPSWVKDAAATVPSRETTAAYGIPEGVSGTLESPTPPGAAIGSLVLVDGLLLFTVLMLGLSLVIPLRLYGRIQGAATLVLSLLWILMSALLTILALAKLMLMIGLFVSAPFGTMAYLAIWGGFPTQRAAAVLALLLLLKIAFGALLVLAQPQFLGVKGLVVLVLLSAVLQLALVFIHGFLPGPVIAMGDQFWAVVTGVVAAVWAIIMLIGAIPAVINAIRVAGSVAE